MTTKVKIVVELEIELLDVEVADVDEVLMNMDYSFSYKDEEANILKTEIIEHL